MDLTSLLLVLWKTIIEWLKDIVSGEDRIYQKLVKLRNADQNENLAKSAYLNFEVWATKVVKDACKK